MGLATPALATAQTGTPIAIPEASPAATPVADAPAPLGFSAIEPDTGDTVVVPEGYEAVAFLQWGDPITADAPEFDVANQTAQSQSQQAGYNADWVEFLPLPLGSDTSDHGLLVVNHEYTNPELMFPGYLTENPEYAAAVAAATEEAGGSDAGRFGSGCAGDQRRYPGVPCQPHTENRRRRA